MNATTMRYLLGLVGTGGIMLIFYGLVFGRRQVDEVALRLERYADYRGPTTARARRSMAPRDIYDRLMDLLNGRMAQDSRTSKLTEELARADLRLKASEWLLGTLSAGALLGALLGIRFGGLGAGTLLGLVAGVVGGYFVGGLVLRLMQARRARAFDRQLGDTIILLSNALKAGYSFAQAISTVSKTASPPIADEFSRATREMALGISVDDALDHMVRRNMSEDFDLMVTAVQIHRVVGGNLAEILDTIAMTIRERVRIKGEIRTLTAQARASGWIITILPIALAGILTVISPDYFKPMFHETLGLIMLGMALFSMGVGFALIQKIVKIEV